MPQPVRYRNVFLFVSGRTPQIITETLFFFVVRHRPAIRPHEIHVLTTTEGQALIQHQLLAAQTGQFYRFCSEYGLDARTIRFSLHTIEVLRDERGVPLSDIRTNTDNRAAADQIVTKVQTLTSDPTVRLLASMAGGRKTMGLYLGFALQFYGRPHDRLTHVLVSPPEWENNPQFFYPSIHDGRSSKHQATITVAEVPLILLGHKLSVLRDRSNRSYATLVAQSQREVDLLSVPLPVTIDRLGRQLQIGEARIRLSGLEFAPYVYIARKRCQAACPQDCGGCQACTVATADFLDAHIISTLEHIATEVGVRDPRLHQLHWWTAEGEEGKKRFVQVCARIKNKIQTVLGAASTPYTIASLPTRQERRASYTLSLSKTLIHFA
jgi:CRISPR-associated protein (TIGR02584 family)